MGFVRWLWAWPMAVLLAWAASFSSPAAEFAADVVVLRYRTAEQVLPLIEPLVPKPGSVNGRGNELVLRTTRANLAEVRKVLAALDRKPRLLLVTVRQDAPEDTGRAAQVIGTRAVDADRSIQQVRVIEGNEADIRLGHSVPVVLRGSGRRIIDGRVVEDDADRVTFRDAMSGFSVRARIAGDAVILDLQPRHDTPGNQGRGSLDVQRITTTLSGRLGEWIEAGAILSGASVRGDTVTYGTRSAGSSARRILVKVEALD